MRRTSIIIISCLIFSCNSKEKGNSDSIVQNADKTFDSRIEQLKLTFKEDDYLSFFKLFPDTYKEIITVYGFDDNTGEKPLYFEAKDHISFLFNPPKEHLTPLVKKSIGIAIEAKWDADAINYFQEELSNLVIKHPEEVLIVLKTKSDKKKADFWNFIFDGSSENDLQNNEKFYRIFEKIKPLDVEQSDILNREFKKLYNHSFPHNTPPHPHSSKNENRFFPARIFPYKTFMLSCAECSAF